MATTVYKPAGIPVFRKHDDGGADCVLARLLDREPARREGAWPEGFEGGIAHRLDISTSGALLVADDLQELAAIREVFASRRLVKTYRLQAAKDPDWDWNVCVAPLAHHKTKRKRMVVRRGESTPKRGRWHQAETRFDRVEGALWQATMRSGVMHQIRVHAAFVGLPLLGDRIYGGGATPMGWPEGQVYRLHHVGLEGGGFATAPVELPAWAQASSTTTGA